MAELPQSPSPSLGNDIYYFKSPCPVYGENILRIPEKNSLNFYVITKYICALLNSKGGTLIIGVEKSFTIRGRKLTRDEIDKFQRHVDEALKQFNPTVKGHEYSINFHPVVFEEGKKIAVRDFYVIEIRINSPDVEDLYFTHYDECWIKKPDNQIDLVPITDLRSYMEKHLNKTFDAKKSALQRQIDLFEGKGLDTVRSDELLKIKQNVSNALYLIQQAKEFQKNNLMNVEK